MRHDRADRLRHRRVAWPALVGGSLVAGALVAGFCAIEFVGVTDLGPRYWRGGLSALGGYLVVGALALALLGYLLRITFHVYKATRATVVWVAAVPKRVVRWAARAGPRGLACHGLTAAVGLVMLALLAALGGFASDGISFWLVAAFNGGLWTALGGGMGALALVTIVSWVTDLLGERVPDLLDSLPATAVVAGIGYTAGAAAAWGSSQEIAQDAVRAGVPITDPWMILLVLHLYAAAWAGLWKTTQVVKVRAGVVPDPRIRHLVWHEGGSVPPKPSDEHWSPIAVVAWRDWNWNGSVLVGHYGREWTASRFVATCDQGHRAPDWHCNCGIYARKDGSGTRGVIGRVELAGIVVEHERGYRAEQGRIVQLWVADEDLAGEIRARYPDVPVTTGQPVHRVHGG